MISTRLMDEINKEPKFRVEKFKSEVICSA